MNIAQLKKALPILFKHGIVVNLIGAHGTGKSQTIRQITESLGLNFIDFRLGQASDSGDIAGLYDFVKDKDGNPTHVKYVRPELLPKTPGNVLFFDEWNRTSKDILQCIFQLVLDKKMGDYTLPENTYIVMASNPPTKDYVVLDFKDKAFQDRFAHIMFQPTPQEFLSFTEKKHGDTVLLQLLKEQNNLIEEGGNAYSLTGITPSRRSNDILMGLEKTELSQDLDVYFEIIMGICGIEVATAYLEKLKNKKSIAYTVDQVVEDFKSVEKIVKQSRDEGRDDLLSKVSNDIIDYLNSKYEVINPTQVANIKYFSNYLTDDQWYGLVSKLESCKPFLNVEGTCTVTKKKIEIKDVYGFNDDHDHFGWSDRIKNQYEEIQAGTKKTPVKKEA